MATFKKRPVIVKAVQWHPGKKIAGVVDFNPIFGVAYIDTLEGRMAVEPNSWIITGVNGEKYPCKDEIFRKTYDPVTAEAAKALETVK